MRKLFCILLAVTCLEGGAETLLLKNARVHTVTGGVIENGAVLVRDGMIEAVGRELNAQADEVVDLEGRHLYPGLFAANTILGLMEINAIRPTLDFEESGEFTPEVQSWLSVNPDSELLPVARANGITHIVPAPRGGRVSGVSGIVALHGWTIEDMAVRKEAALHISWPSMSLNLRREGGREIKERAKERREDVRELTDFFEQAEAYAKARENGGEFVPAWEAMLPVPRKEIPIVIHADEYRQIQSALEWTKERGCRWILAGARDAWRLASELAEAEVPVIYERIYDALPAGAADPYDLYFTAPAVLHEAGVKLILGEGLSGDGASNLRNLPHTAAQAIAFGLPAEAALKAITLHPAEAFGVANRLGSIEPGKEATLFAATGDIFDIRSRVTQMWFRGEPASLESRHTRLYEKYKNRPRPNE